MPTNSQINRRLHNKQSESESEVRRIQNLVDSVIEQRAGDLPNTLKKMQEEIDELRFVVNVLQGATSSMLKSLSHIAAAGEAVARDGGSTPSERLDALCYDLSLARYSAAARSEAEDRPERGGVFNPTLSQRFIDRIETPVRLYNEDDDTPQISFPPFGVRIRQDDDDIPSSLLDDE